MALYYNRDLIIMYKGHFQKSLTKKPQHIHRYVLYESRTQFYTLGHDGKHLLIIIQYIAAVVINNHDEVGTWKRERGKWFESHTIDLLYVLVDIYLLFNIQAL